MHWGHMSSIILTSQLPLEGSIIMILNKTNFFLATTAGV